MQLLKFFATISILTLFFASCPGQEESETTTSAPVDMTPYGAYPEPVVISASKVYDPQPHFPEGDDAGNNAMTRYIKEKFNIDYDIAWQAPGEEYANKLSLNIASGDLPDMVPIGISDYLVFISLQQNQMLADLTEPLQLTANDYIKRIMSSYDYANQKPFRVGGRDYAIAGTRYGYEHPLLWVRKDWMERYNLDAPQTIEDIENIARRFIEEQPSGPNVGIAAHRLNPLNSWGRLSLGPIIQAFGAIQGLWIEGDDGKITYSSLDPRMKEGLTILARWYEEGIIDRQFPTRSADAETPLITGGQTGIFWAPWWETYASGDLPVNDPEATWNTYALPLDANGRYNIQDPIHSGDFAVINKNYAHPEALLKILNAEFDMWRGFDLEASKLVQPSRDSNVSWGTLFLTGYLNFEVNTIVPETGRMVVKYLETGEESTSNPNWSDQVLSFCKDAAIYYNSDRSDPGSMSSSWLHYFNRAIASPVTDVPENNFIPVAYAFATESMPALRPTLDKLENEMIFNIITGNAPLSSFDQFVEEWRVQGGDRLIAEVQAVVDNK